MDFVLRATMPIWAISYFVNPTRNGRHSTSPWIGWKITLPVELKLPSVSFNKHNFSQSMFQSSTAIFQMRAPICLVMLSSSKSYSCTPVQRKSALQSQWQYLQAHSVVSSGLHYNEIKLIRLAHLNVKLWLLQEPGRFSVQKAISVHLGEKWKIFCGSFQVISNGKW